MTSAPKVRLLTLAVIALAVLAWRPALSAQVAQYPDQSGYDQYVPDGSADEWWDISAYVSIVDGSAELLRADDSTRDFEQVPLEVGDTIRTSRGRVEILFHDGSVISLDEYSSVTIDSQQLWRVHEGRLKVTWQGGPFDVEGVPAGRARLRTSGEYWVTYAANRRGEAELELAVSRGSAELDNARGRTLVGQGTRALTTERYAPSVAYAFAAPRDSFDQWTTANETDRYGIESARYLPTELRAYGGTFDRYGSWSNHSSYGWVWYPRVSVGWRPYYGGRWNFIVNFGYSWVGGARWEWPAYHYGRWDQRGAQWFWVPSRTIRTRHVGYAVPRRSVTTAVSRYLRPTSTRSVTSRGTQTYRGAGSRATIGQQPRASQPSRAVPRGGADRRLGTSQPPANRSSESTTRQVPTRSSQLPTSTRQSTAGTRTPTATARRAPDSSRAGNVNSGRQQPTIQSRPLPAAQNRRAPSSQTRPAPSPRQQVPQATRSAPQGSRTPSRTARPAPVQRSTPSSAGRSSAPSTRSVPNTRSGQTKSVPSTRSAPPSGSRTPSARGRSSGSTGTATRRPGRGGRGGGGGSEI